MLEAAGIPVKVDLPGVGENVQGHISVGVTWSMLLALRDEMKLMFLDSAEERCWLRYFRASSRS